MVAYDPAAMDNAKKVIGGPVLFANSAAEAISSCDAVLILTEWDEVKNLNPKIFKTMKYPLVIDGRNCFGLERMREHEIEYHSVGRPAVKKLDLKTYA